VLKGNRMEIKHNMIIISFWKEFDTEETSEEDKEKEEGNSKPSSIAFFASNTTFHGISHFLGTEISWKACSVRRLFWGVAFFGSLFGLLVQVILDITVLPVFRINENQNTFDKRNIVKIFGSNFWVSCVYSLKNWVVLTQISTRS